MRRMYAGLGILLVLLAISIGVTIVMEAVHNPISQALEEAIEAARQGNWALAEDRAFGAKNRWEQYWQFTAAVADQTPMDELDGLFAELEAFLDAREMPHFEVTARHLSQLAQAMAMSHLPSWWNFF